MTPTVTQSATNCCGRWRRACASVCERSNVSAVQFARASVLPDVAAALAATGLPARRLELGVTESAMLKDAASALSVLHTLREKGVSVALDDFGTGYSSLIHLRGFPFDHLKIDRSFVRDAPERPDLRAIIRGTTGLAAGMQMQTTA